jgi:hypothetical protein
LLPGGEIYFAACFTTTKITTSPAASNGGADNLGVLIMGSNWSKAGSSRITAAQVVNLSSAVAVNSSPFGSETYQIRVISPIAAWLQIGTSTTSAAVGTAGNVFIAANTASGDYFTVTPGQTISLVALSSASTGTVSVTELS